MYIGSTNVFRVQNSEHVYNYIVQTISLTKAGMVTAKERALAWGREIQEASSRAQRELERDEEKIIAPQIQNVWCDDFCKISHSVNLEIHISNAVHSEK